MPGALYHVGVTALCPHAGQVTAITSNTRVLLGGQPATTQADTYTIAGCVFNVSSSPHPCVKVQWLAPATRVKINGQPAILQTSPGLSLAADQAPQGSPIVVAGQLRVSGV
jgi:hypothetical protein